MTVRGKLNRKKWFRRPIVYSEVLSSKKQILKFKTIPSERPNLGQNFRKHEPLLFHALTNKKKQWRYMKKGKCMVTNFRFAGQKMEKSYFTCLPSFDASQIKAFFCGGLKITCPILLGKSFLCGVCICAKKCPLTNIILAQQNFNQRNK